jgi:hypothetical protein
MSEEPETITVMCAEDIPGQTFYVRGHVRRRCEVCDTPITVAPVGQEMIRRAGEHGRLVCTTCGFREAEERGEQPIITPAAILEAQKALRDGSA